MSFLEKIMSTQITEPELIDKINSIVEGLKSSLNHMSVEEIESLEKCIMNLFLFHKTFLEAKNHLDKLLKPEDEKKSNDVIEKFRQEHKLFFKEMYKKD